MQMDVSWKRVVVIFVSLLLPTSLIMGGYYLFIKPLQSQIEQVHQEIKTEEKLASIIQQKGDQKAAVLLQNTAHLQQKVPVAPLVDQFLLDLEKAEVLSDSLILSYGISDGDETFKSEENSTTNEIQNPLNETKEQPSDSAQPNEASPLPQGIKRLTVNLSVTSPNYTQMEQFLTRMEKLKRVTNIESLSFTGNPEVMVLSDQKPEMNYTVQVSTFYAPQLKELIKDLPHIEYPEPSHRTNPLSWNEVLDEKTLPSNP